MQWITALYREALNSLDSILLSTALVRESHQEHHRSLRNIRESHSETSPECSASL